MRPKPHSWWYNSPPTRSEAPIAIQLTLPRVVSLKVAPCPETPRSTEECCGNCAPSVTIYIPTNHLRTSRTFLLGFTRDETTTTEAISCHHFCLCTWYLGADLSSTSVLLFVESRGRFGVRKLPCQLLAVEGSAISSRCVQCLEIPLPRVQSSIDRITHGDRWRVPKTCRGCGASIANLCFSVWTVALGTSWIGKYCSA